MVDKVKLISLWVRYAAVQLVKALHYKLEGKGFDSKWGQWDCSLTLSFWLHCIPRVGSAFNKQVPWMSL
jgi:hypothetical protein